jgi:hypothetical protein
MVKRAWQRFPFVSGRAVAESIRDSFFLKGGITRELRFAERARATDEIDIGVLIEQTKTLRVSQDAVPLDSDNFTFS